MASTLSIGTFGSFPILIADAPNGGRTQAVEALFNIQISIPYIYVMDIST